ncbi:MAG: hypothetical protein QNJ98_19350 [Planctomycetota bacterium]|nr:hypothetical protein [Planctomycetota bacterium]
MSAHEDRGLVALPAGLRSRLTKDDDPLLWQTALAEVLQEIDARWEVEPPGVRRIQVGLFKVNSWRRPNQCRWIRGGGFAYPESYDWHAHQNAEWGVWFSRTCKSAWSFTPEREPFRTRRGTFALRVCIPGRTTRHHQAALGCEWFPRSPWHRKDRLKRKLALYGYRRNPSGIWNLVAHWENAPKR